MLMQSEIAGMGRRVLATVLDFVILMVALLVMTRNMSPLSHPAIWWVLVFAIAVVYSALFGVRMGRTPGKMALGLRVIDGDGGGLDYAQMFRRAALKWSPIFALFIAMALLTPEALYPRPANDEGVNTVEVEAEQALASSAVMMIGTVGWLVLIHLARRHPDGQGLHDRAARTYVIEMR